MLLKEGNSKTVLMACGASGGHIFPALAVAQDLKKQGVKCVFVGNKSRFLDVVKAEGFVVDCLPSSPWNVRNPIKKLKALFLLMRSLGSALHIIRKYKASVVFGTGGYATVSLVFAAKILGVPTLITEQNVLPGRANRFLSKWVDRVCLTFESSRHYLKYREGAIVTTGNPIRESIVHHAQKGQLTKKEKHKKTVLVLGGSQGARVLSDYVPQAVNGLSNAVKSTVKIIQQTRPEDESNVVDMYKHLGIDAEVKSFFNNMEEIWQEADVLVGRSGASTICEAFLFGVGAVYIPLLLADGHQVLNAKAVESKGAAVLLDQSDLTVEKLSETLEDILSDETRLSQMKEAAYAQAQPKAAANVAKEVLRLTEKDVLHFEKEM